VTGSGYPSPYRRPLPQPSVADPGREVSGHRAYQRLAEDARRQERASNGMTGAGLPRRESDSSLSAASGPAAAPGRSPATSEQPEVCGRCDAPRSCCHCGADVADLRRFATRMAVIHAPTGMPVCGCGTHNCYVRRRLDDIDRGVQR
jgi:hypothetical protein